MSGHIELKCVVCGEKDLRPTDECKGKDNPSCELCFGPMIAVSAKLNGTPQSHIRGRE